MSFNPNAGSIITLQEGAAMTAEYRNANPNDINAHYFSKAIIDRLLSQTGAVGLRFYYGLDPNNNNEKELVFVAVDANGNDILNQVADRSQKCPTECGNTNALNS